MKNKVGGLLTILFFLAIRSQKNLKQFINSEVEVSSKLLGFSATARRNVLALGDSKTTFINREIIGSSPESAMLVGC